MNVVGGGSVVREHARSCPVAAELDRETSIGQMRRNAVAIGTCEEAEDRMSRCKMLEKDVERGQGGFAGLGLL